MRFPKNWTRCLLGLGCGLFLAVSATAGECPICPTPRRVTDLEQTLAVHSEDLAILTRFSRTPMEEYAMETLLQQLRNRFHAPFERGKMQASTLQIVLDVQPANGTLPPNGFSITFGENKVTVLGADPNGVIYGADALFQLFRKTAEGKIELQMFNVVDYPSIPWRGRPHFVLMQNLVPGALDAYAHARINYTDVRDNPKYTVNNTYPDRAAPMGFPPGVPLDTENIKRMITESQRRGMFVYGTVAAATTQKAQGIITGFDKLNEDTFYQDVERLYEELLALGVDGLWLSFDDIGAGTDSKKAVELFLALGQKHHLSGKQLAYTPPDGDYQNIDRPFNREMAKVPEFNAIQWFFTRVPCEADLRLCEEMGLKGKPGWWHNLIFLRSGFLNNGNIAVSLRPGFIDSPTFRHADGKTRIPLPAYIELHPLAAGWGTPKPDDLRDAAKYTDNALLWCIGGGFPEEYLVTMFGYWAWNPETYDWAKVQRAIYAHVYGPEMAMTAQAFDEKLRTLKSFYRLPPRTFEPDKEFPPRLAAPENREKALALLDELDALCRTLCENAPKASALNADRLEFVYLEPMRKTLEIARTVTNLTFPEEGMPAEEIERCLKEIEAKLSGELKGIDGYTRAWRERIR